LLIAAIARHRSVGRAEETWGVAASSALRDAELTRDMLEGEARPGEPEDPSRRTAVRDNVERVAARFDQLAAGAPNDDAKRQAAAVASSLRGYQFALEAEQLLRAAPTPPSADQLAAADAARRSRAGELDAGLAAIRARLTAK
jgi:hypothetical protein